MHNYIVLNALKCQSDQACPRGYQPSEDINSVCGECSGNPRFYDWLYLGFMALVSVLLHFFFIDYTNIKKGYLLSVYM